ncbi:MAG: hypothetical protein KJ607_07465, partial [Bacteroidetes bacterium]|nr:hypothetical protein [Bacteroidota bacterium]
MKRILASLMLSAITIVSLLPAIRAQVGSTCSNPHVISTLPFSYSGTTQGSGNDYSATGDCGGSGYITGEDYVFTYTPTGVENISITLSNLTGYGGYGLYVLDGCIDLPASICIASDEASTGVPVIDQISLIPGITYYIFISTYAYGIYNTFTDFTIDIELLPSAAEDGGVSGITTAPSSCNLSASEQITMEIRNYGTTPIGSFDVNYQVNGGPAVTETYTGSVNPGATANYTFTTTADLSAAGTGYEITAFTSVVNDTVTNNDTYTKIVTHSNTIASFPYFEDFESGTGGWFTEGTNNSWEHGIPSGDLINSAASDSICWATNLSGDYNNDENSSLFSPCYDLSLLIHPMIEMKIHYEMELASAIMLYSTDYGYTWIKIGEGEPISQNWYNNEYNGSTGWNGQSGEWITVKHSLDSLGGLNGVMLRIKFEGITTGILVQEGMAVDDIRIKEVPQNDVGITAVTAPHSGCGLSGNEDVTVAIINQGMNDQHGFTVTYSTDGGSTFTTETITDTISYEETYLH